MTEGQPHMRPAPDAIQGAKDQRHAGIILRRSIRQSFAYLTLDETHDFTRSAIFSGVARTLRFSGTPLSLLPGTAGYGTFQGLMAGTYTIGWRCYGSSFFVFSHLLCLRVPH